MLYLNFKLGIVTRRKNAFAHYKKVRQTDKFQVFFIFGENNLNKKFIESLNIKFY